MDRHQISQALFLLRSLWSQPQANAAISGAGVDTELPVYWPDGHDELPLECFTQDDVEEGVNAAVGIAQANSDVVGVDEGPAGALHPQVDQLNGAIGGPAEEESQADSHCHAGHFLGPHPQAAWGQRGHAGGHVLADLEEHHTDDAQGQGKGQDKLVEGEPVDVDSWVGEQEGTAHQAVLQGHEAGVHPHRDIGEQGQPPHEDDDGGGDARPADVVEADGVDGGEVAVQGHGGEDVGAHDLTVGVERRDDGAHGGAKAPRAVAQQLVDEKGHAEEEEEVNNRQVEDEDIRYRLLGTALGLLDNGVDDDAVAKDAQEADDAKDDGEDSVVVRDLFLA